RRPRGPRPRRVARGQARLLREAPGEHNRRDNRDHRAGKPPRAEARRRTGGDGRSGRATRGRDDPVRRDWEGVSGPRTLNWSGPGERTESVWRPDLVLPNRIGRAARAGRLS